jgi:hypothetical protein
MRGTSVPSSSRKMQARSTSPSSASWRQAAPRSWSMDWACDAASIRLSSTDACSTRRRSDRLAHASATAAESLGTTWRSRCGDAAAAGSTVRTPMTSPSRISGSPWPERMPRAAHSLSIFRRPSARATTGRWSRMTVERREDWARVTGVRSRGWSGACSPEVETTRWNGTAISVDASCTHTEMRVAPVDARSRASRCSIAAWASKGDDGAGRPAASCRARPSDTRSRSAFPRSA